MYSIEVMPDQIPVDSIAALQRVETAMIGHVRHHGFMDNGIRPLLPALRIAGTAVTISLPGPDATLLHHVMPLLRAGDVLVIERCGDVRHSVWGGVINQAARLIGLAGVVIDGPITDPNEMSEQGVAIWHRGISPVTSKPVAIGGLFNVPVSCGGVAVLPGDAILADDSGVLVMRAGEVDDITRVGLARQQREPGIVRRILDGEAVGEVSGASPRFREAMAGSSPR